MQSKINKVKKDLRAMKKSAHAIERLIEIQGTHFKRIDALNSLPHRKEQEALVKCEMELISRLGVEREIEKSVEIEKRYSAAIGSLSLEDRAMLLDCYVSGKPYWKIGMEYGFSEEGARKHLGAIIKKIAGYIDCESVM